MGKRAPLVSVVALTVILSGCAAPVPPQNPVQDLIDIVPWAKSIAHDATAQDVAARIEELSAGLPNLDITDAAKTQIRAELEQLRADVSVDPGSLAAHIEALRAIIAEVQDAVAAGG